MLQTGHGDGSHGPLELGKAPQVARLGAQQSGPAAARVPALTSDFISHILDSDQGRQATVSYCWGHLSLVNGNTASLQRPCSLMGHREMLGTP